MKISQREAQRLRKRVDELERMEARRAATWINDWPGGVNFWTLELSPAAKAAVTTARSLGHYIVGIPYNSDLQLYAIKVKA